MLANTLFLQGSVAMLTVMQIVGNSVIGGTENHVLDLMQGLEKSGVNVEVICPRPGPLSEQLARLDIRAQFVEMVHPWINEDYLLDRDAISNLSSLIKKKRPDVVHSHLYPAYLHASLAAKETGVRAIVNTAHNGVIRPRDALLSHMTGAHTIAISQGIAHLLRSVGVPEQSIEVIYKGIGPEHFEDDIEALQRLRAELGLESRLIIGTSTRLSQEKGVDSFLYAMRQVTDIYPDIIGLIIGDGPQATELGHLADELGLQDTVHFLGTRKDIPVLNRLLDIFVLPSRRETFPMTLLEAMAASRTVIATNVGGTTEVITHAVDGWLIPPDDPWALSKAILMLLKHPARRAAMGAVAHRKVVSHFSRDRMVQQTLAFYEHLLGMSSRPELLWFPSLWLSRR
jgi:glycosyltransferase involved in cell wall biosynthesis